jgi:hypothetical protein
MASVSGIFLRLTLDHLLRVVAEVVEFRGDGLYRGQCLLSIAVVREELATDFRGAQAGVEPVRAELWVRLTLAIDNGTNIRQQLGQVVFRALATTEGKGIEAGKSAFQLMHAFADGHPAPPEFAFCAPLSAGPQFFDGAGHKQPAGTALERCRCLDEQRLERVREFHGDSSRKDLPGVYHRSGLVLFSRVPNKT